MTGLVATAAGAQLARDRSGPVVSYAQDGAMAEFVGMVTTEPRVISSGDERQALVVLELRLEQVHARGVTTRVSTPLVVMAREGQGWEDLRWRSTIVGWGKLQLPQEPERAVAMVRPRGAPTTTRAPSPVLAATDHVRDRFRAAVAPLPPDARGLVPGLVIGDTSLTPPDLTEAMRATGMTHLSAVSGSNVALVLGAIALLVARLGVPRRWRTPLILLGLIGFVLLCRPEPSVLRAGVMGTVGLLALSSARRKVSLPALAAAVIGLLCVDPWLARSYGFALSTLATLGLVLWSRPWADAIAARLPRRAAIVGDAISVPLAAQVACAPVIVLLQGSITTVAVLANVLAAPLVAPTTVLGVLAAVLSPLWMPLGRGIAWCAALPAWLLGKIARRCAELPWGTVDWVDGVIGAWLLTLLTVLALVTGPWWRHLVRQHRWASWTLLAAALATLWPVPSLGGWPPPGWTVIGCDVGQGDAFVIRSGRVSAVLVDTGPAPEDLRRCLRDLGIKRLDAVVLTHFHADHVGGLDGALRTLPVETAYLSPVEEPAAMAALTLRELAAAGVEGEVLGAGQVREVGQARLEVLSPGDPPVAGQSPANNGSLVLDIRTPSLRMLFTGDIEPEGARPLRGKIEGRDYDVLKVAHHGSAAQDKVLVHGTQAEVALIGVGAENTFGHPAPSALTLLREAGMVVLRTDLHGDVAVAREDGFLVVHRREG
ncbi:MAG: DNA internalization-related competence protein ComEC/Rec2 [Ornithinimicrobium sp.]|uniref:DNA internalization-related competence protein ComEC/Rec2 n=1 Tax=Ornithinimicrobium sp. TaxID=1977084 RepID=UPI0026DF5059|nr:DNA internalization-related competence protein ComEC/Rec2 [Ornithinimicrobium sp.]MDO5741145.1 DNA internalization-related competence protein ComEC/Rec2 [Ornithinimicrobium sp.]